MKSQVACALLIGFVAPVELRATDWTARLGVGLIETDNVQRTATDAMSDTIGDLSADLNLHQQTRRVDADMISNLQYLTYEHDVYRSDVVGNFAGNGKYAVLPGHFEWVVQDNFGQQELQPGTPITPLNLENINYLSTGPNLLISLGPQLHAQLSARYSKVSYQISDLDNNRGDASVALVHSLSTNSNVSLNIDAERVRYEDSVTNPDFTTQQGYLRYDAQGGRSKLALDLGYEDATGLSSKGGGALVRAEASRNISASSHLDFSFGQEISDTGNLLRQLQGLDGVAVGATSLQRSNDPFISRYARIGWQLDGHRTTISFDVERFQEQHLDFANLDQRRTQADITLRRNLTPALTAVVTASYGKATYNSIVGGSRDQIDSAVLEWRIDRRLDMKVEYDHFDHSGDSASNEYVENRLAISVGMRLGSVT